MLQSLIKRFRSIGPDDAGDELELKLAAATLMYEVIRADGKIDDTEQQSMRRILQQEFELDDSELEDLFQQSVSTAHNATSLQLFTREICENWGNEQRVQLLGYLWLIALADDHIDSHERHLIRKVAGLLYLTDLQIVQSREWAKRQRGGS